MRVTPLTGSPCTEATHIEPIATRAFERASCIGTIAVLLIVVRGNTPPAVQIPAVEKGLVCAVAQLPPRLST